jgi:antitoxin VapB
VSTSLTEIAVGLTGEAGLIGDGLNTDVGFLEEFVEAFW